MTNREREKNKEKEDNKDAAVKPDPKTLNTTDPQEHMEGPVSSLMHEAGDAFSEEAEREAKQKKDSE
jgi:hypothetical protein